MVQLQHCGCQRAGGNDTTRDGWGTQEPTELSSGTKRAGREGGLGAGEAKACRRHCSPASALSTSPSLAAMVPKTRTTAVSPAQLRSFPKEATRYAGATRTARASSGPPC